MKHLNRLVIVSCFCLFTCQTDNVTQQQESLELDTELSSADTQRQSAKAKNDFEVKLQWAAYAAAKVYLHDKEAREEMQSYMTNDNTISLEKLLGPRSKSSPFYKGFVRELIYYYQDLHDKSDEEDEEDPEDTPKDDIAVCCSVPPTPDEAAGRFIDYLVDDNCVEFFLPNYDIFSIDEKLESIASTAHPLTNAEDNYGFWRFPEPYLFPDDAYSTANEITVDSEFVAKQTLVLIARPIRDESNRNCEYKEYDVEDFTEFLSIE